MALLWPGQRNGLISLSLMSLVLNYRLHPAAAVSFLAMRVALFAATGTWLGISDAYRSLAEQDRVFRQRYTSGWPSGIGYAGQKWRKRAGVPVAAVPGTSNHGWALALDIRNYGATNGRVFRWLLDHAAAFGWSWTTGRNVNEPWHWEYVGSLVRPAGGGGIPIPSEPEFDYALQRRLREETMYVQHEDKRYPQVYATFTDANGALRLRACKANEAAIALAGGLVIAASDGTLTDLGIEAGFNKEGTIPLPKVAGASAAGSGTFTEADRARLEAVPTADQNGQASRHAIVAPKA